jgi:hypothetical protein
VAVEDGCDAPPIDARRGFSRYLIDEEQSGEGLSEWQIGRGWEVFRGRLPGAVSVGGARVGMCVGFRWWCPSQPVLSGCGAGCFPREMVECLHYETWGRQLVTRLTRCRTSCTGPPEWMFEMVGVWTSYGPVFVLVAPPRRICESILDMVAGAGRGVKPGKLVTPGVLPSAISTVVGPLLVSCGVWKQGRGGRSVAKLQWRQGNSVCSCGGASCWAARHRATRPSKKPPDFTTGSLPLT